MSNLRSPARSPLILIGVLPIAAHAIVVVALIGIGVVAVALVVALIVGRQPCLEVALAAERKLLLTIQVVRSTHVRRLQAIHLHIGISLKVDKSYVRQA